MRVKSRILKTSIVFINAFLLAFNPTALAVSKGEYNSVKSVLELTEITKREVPLKEFFAKVSHDMPPAMKEQFQAILKESPDLVLPKFNVSKIPGAGGDEDIQLQFIKERRAGVVTLVGRGQTFAKVGNSTILFSDLADPELLHEKFMTEFPKNGPPRAPASEAPAFQMLSSGDFQKLTKDEQKQYIKDLRQMMATLEQLQNQQIESQLKGVKKSKQKDYGLLLELLIQSADAAPSSDYAKNESAAKVLKVGAPCVYAGHMADYGCKEGKPDKNGKCNSTSNIGYKCGGSGSKFNIEIMSNLNCMTGGQAGIYCATSIYGNPDNGKPACVRRSNDATTECNEKTKNFDYFKKNEYKGAQEWDEEKAKLDKLVAAQLGYCADVEMKTQPALADQGPTCDALVDRIDQIKRTICPFEGTTDPKAKADLAAYKAKDRFKDSYCAKVGETAPPTTTPAVVPGTKVDAPACKEEEWVTPKDGKSMQADCIAKGGKVEVCPGDSGYWKCGQCPERPGNPANTFSFKANNVVYGCVGTGDADAKAGTSGKPEEDGFWKKTKSWFSKNKSWLIPTSLLAVVGYLGYKAWKKSTDSYYKYLTPGATATPVPGSDILPTPRVRGTRTTQ